MRIVIIEDHASFREALRLALSQTAGISVVGEAGDAREAFTLITRLQPEVAIVDVSLALSDGIALARDLRRQRIASRVFILTMHHERLFVREAFEAGACGYALKHQPIAEIIAGVQACARGERYVSPLVDSTAVRVEPRPDTAVALSFLERLSRREREIACQLIAGASSRSLAESLCISVKTVESHRSRINQKLGTRTIADLVRLAALRGLIPGQQPQHR
jgi:two-component system response regulator NreC